MQKVLVIEDDKLSLNLMLKTLRRAGFEAIGADSGAAGIELARAHRPDLIISDVLMDDVDGYSALAQIRNDAATAAIPFILMTGQASRAGMRQGMELGADDYLTKPFKVEELLAAVNARLRKQERARAVMRKQLRSLRKTISSAVPKEVREPLSVMMSCAQALRTHAAALRPQDVVKMANAIDTAGQRLLLLFEKFLLYSYLEVVAADEEMVKQLRAESTPDVTRVLEPQVRELAARYHRSHDLVLELEEGGVRMREDYLERVVEELVENAFKFSDPCTTVVVTTSVHEGTFTLAVQDYGRGMTPEQVESIDAFIRFEEDGEVQRGLGLGLSIVSRLAHLHDGVFTVQSDPGGGTYALLKLPAVCV